MQITKVLLMQRSLDYRSDRRWVQCRTASQWRNWLLLQLNYTVAWTIPLNRPCQHGTVAHVHISPLFEQVDPVETDHMLDPKRSPLFCNAFTGKKGHIQILSQKMRNSFILDLKNNFIILVLCIWVYEGRDNRGGGVYCIMRSLMICTAEWSVLQNDMHCWMICTAE